MSEPPSPADAAVVSAQTARVPRTPWRVAARCAFGHPMVIVSPSRLDDGTPFPNLAWLTCPFLADRAAAAESAGGAAVWAGRAAHDRELAAALAETDAAVRTARRAESGGHDACAGVGIAGQRDPLGVKCLHAHLALALAGIADPIGAEMLAEGRECDDRRCDVYLTDSESE